MATEDTELGARSRAMSAISEVAERNYASAWLSKLRFR